MNYLVTGASRGIGLCIAKQLASLGHNVTLCARNPETLKTSMASLPIVKDGQKHDMWALDMADLTAVSKMEGCPRPLSDYDGFVNSAGIVGGGNFIDLSNATIESILNINLYSPILMAKQVALAMVRNTSEELGDTKRRHIVFLSSIAGRKGVPGASTYSATKAGLEGFVRSLAREIGSRGIAVNAVAPGVTETEMGVDNGESALAGNIFKGYIDPNEIAEAILYILRSKSITGQTIVVDNGLTV